MEDGPAFEVNGKFSFFLDEAAMGNVTAGRNVTGQIDNVTDFEVLDVFVLDGRMKDDLSY